MKCPSCGADISPTEEQCSHCGSHIPSKKSSSESRVFARIKASAQYADRNAPARIARLPNAGAMQKVFLNVFFVMFIGISASMVVFLLGMAGVVGVFGFRAQGGMAAAFSLGPLLMACVPIGFVVFGVLMFRHLKKKMHSLEHDPVAALPVIVIGKRTHVSGGSGDSSSHTSYFITCETEDGKRQEYQVWDGQLYGKLTADDAGIVFVRAGYGLDFDRVAT